MNPFSLRGLGLRGAMGACDGPGSDSARSALLAGGSEGFCAWARTRDDTSDNFGTTWTDGIEGSLRDTE